MASPKIDTPLDATLFVHDMPVRFTGQDCCRSQGRPSDNDTSIFAIQRSVSLARFFMRGNVRISGLNYGVYSINSCCPSENSSPDILSISALKIHRLLCHHSGLSNYNLNPLSPPALVNPKYQEDPVHPDQSSYYKFTSRSRMEKSINSLVGLVEGIAIDRKINTFELGFLNRWLDEHDELRDRHPYNELLPVVQIALSDGALSQNERDDILWLCERLTSTEFFDRTTASLQRLHGIVGGIIADGEVTEEELRGLSDWLEDHDYLRTCWPYDEVSSIITAVMADGKIDEQEQTMLKEFFSEFVHILDERTITSPHVAIGASIVGLCAVCPEIEFAGKNFCFTGSSNRHTRIELTALVKKFGGEVASSLTATVTYLVIGAEGNPCWAYACYGRKVEKAVALRKAGSRVLLVHENDFHDAIADSR